MVDFSSCHKLQRYNYPFLSSLITCHSSPFQTIYTIAQDNEINFLAFYGAIGLWNTFFLFLYSFFNMSRLMKVIIKQKFDQISLLMLACFLLIWNYPFRICKKTIVIFLVFIQVDRRDILQFHHDSLYNWFYQKHGQNIRKSLLEWKL